MGRQRLRFWILAGAALLAGLLLRLWLIAHFVRVAGDSLIYGDIAKNWLLHGVYGFTEDGAAPRPTLIRLPGYPMFLAACFRLFGMEHYNAVLFVQVWADLLTCCLASALAARLFDRRALLPVLWISAMCPFTAAYAAAALTETLVLTCMALTFYAMARWQESGLGFNRWLWGITAGLSYGILLRPEQGLMAAAVVPAMLWMALRTPERRRRLFASGGPVLVAAVCVLLPLVPWTARNWRTFHVVEPLAPRSASDPGEREPVGFERWYRSWAIEFASTAEVYWNYDGDRIEPADLPERAYARGCDAFSRAGRGALRERTEALLDDYNETTAASPALDARFAELARARIHADPVCYYVGLPVARLLNMLLRPRTEMTEIPLQWWRWSEHPGATAVAGALAALNVGYLGAGWLGWLAWRRRGWLGRQEIAWAMAGSILLRCALLLTLDNSEPRYTLEFFPVLFVLAGGLFLRDAGAAGGPASREAP